MRREECWGEGGVEGKNVRQRKREHTDKWNKRGERHTQTKKTPTCYPPQ